MFWVLTLGTVRRIVREKGGTLSWRRVWARITECPVEIEHDTEAHGGPFEGGRRLPS